MGSPGTVRHLLLLREITLTLGNTQLSQLGIGGEGELVPQQDKTELVKV